MQTSKVTLHVDNCPLHSCLLHVTFADMDIRKKFGKKIKEMRQSKNLSQEALAHLAELDRTYIPSIEKGERNVSIEVIQKLSVAFGIKISELLKDLD